MAQKKSELDVGKGLNRIYFVVAGLWVAFVFMLFIGDFFACKIHTDLSHTYPECDDYHAGNQVLQLFIFGGLVVPLYYFLRWIGVGFKK